MVLKSLKIHCEITLSLSRKEYSHIYINLRNTISHSFVTVEEEKNDDTLHGKCLIFDDRLIHNRKEHEQKGNHSEAYSISINHAHKKLLEMVNEIIEF